MEVFLPLLGNARGSIPFRCWVMHLGGIPFRCWVMHVEVLPFRCWGMHVGGIPSVVGECVREVFPSLNVGEGLGVGSVMF